MLVKILQLFLIPLLVATSITYILEYVLERKYTKMATDISLIMDIIFLAFLLVMYIKGYGFMSVTLAGIAITAFILMLELFNFEI